MIDISSGVAARSIQGAVDIEHTATGFISLRLPSLCRSSETL